MSLKTILLASSVTLVSGYAFAADIVAPSYDAPISAPAQAFNWSGAYVGVNLGYGGGEFGHPFAATEEVLGEPLDGSLDISAGGFLGGVQAGYNWQSGSFVYGVEADFQGSGIDAMDNLDLNIGSVELGTEVEWFGTIRARLGMAATDSLLAYVTGGAAYGRTHSSLSLNGSEVAGEKNTEWGWTAGAGVEYAVTNNVTLKTEYLYTDLGKATLFADDFVSLENDVAFHTVRFGINYKF